MRMVLGQLGSTPQVNPAARLIAGNMRIPMLNRASCVSAPATTTPRGATPVTMRRNLGPALALTCGALIPCQSADRARSALSGIGGPFGGLGRTRSTSPLGVYVGCAPFQLAIKRLKAVLDQAKAVGVDGGSGAILAAQSYLSEFDGVFNLTVIYDDKACQTATVETERHISNVAALIDAKNGKGTSDPTAGPLPDPPLMNVPLSDKPGDQGTTELIMTALKWGGIGLGALAIAYMVGPAVRAVAVRAASAIGK